jgi:hypothetical protein
VPRIGEVTVYRNGIREWQAKNFSPAGYIEMLRMPGQLVAYTPSAQEITRFNKLEERHSSKREKQSDGEHVKERSSSQPKGRPKKCGKALSMN